MLVRFNFLGTLLLPVFACFTPTAFYPQAYSISALALFEISVFRFTLSREKSHRLFLSFHHIGMCYIPFALSNHFSLDPLILSIYLFRLIYLFHRYFYIIVPLFSFIVWCFFWRQQHQGFTFILFSSTSPLCLTSLFFLILSLQHLSVCPQQICTLFTSIYDESFYVFFSPLHHRMKFVSRHECPSAFYLERMQYLSDSIYESFKICTPSFWDVTFCLILIIIRKVQRVIDAN